MLSSESAKELTTRFGYAYAKDTNKRDVCVALEILGQVDEDRASIVNKDYAIFYCSEAKVRWIRLLYGPLSCTTAVGPCGENDVRIVYEPGKIVRLSSVPNIDVRLHYFLTEDAVRCRSDRLPDCYTGPRSIYADDGRLRARGQYEYGKRTEEWTFWHDNGEPSKRGTFVEGEMHGTWYRWYDNGQLEEEVTYKHGAWCESIVGWHLHGQLAKRINLVKGRLHGESTWWYPNGNKKSVSCFRDGAMHGVEMGFHENGELAFWRLRRWNRSVGIFDSWHKDGRVNKRINHGRFKGLKPTTWYDEYGYFNRPKRRRMA